jgi:hypothetical protein
MRLEAVRSDDGVATSIGGLVRGISRDAEEPEGVIGVPTIRLPDVSKANVAEVSDEAVVRGGRESEAVSTIVYPDCE